MNIHGLLKDIFGAALKEVEPYSLVADYSEKIRAAYREGGYQRLIVAGFGKASCGMARALEDSLGDIIETGIVITKYGHAASGRGLSLSTGEATRSRRIGTVPVAGRIETYEAGHPVPDEKGLRATEKIISMIKGADEQTLVVCLISGGGSSLLVSPYGEITLGDKRRITDALLRAGADITELNAVRKHISKVKGGRLAGIAYPAGILSLIVSDVIGDSLDVIASGPTAPDGTTFQDALKVLDKFGLKKDAPAAILKTLETGAAGMLPETPKRGEKIFDKVENIIIGNNRMALRAAGREAEALGLRADIIAADITGEAREAAKQLAERAKSVRSSKPSGPVCLISGGETTVTVGGKGKGGRNTELALSFAVEVEGHEGITLLSAGTDGTDGPTDAAGAIVNGGTIKNARVRGLDAHKYLSDNDSYAFFEQTGDLFITGPTGTNVMDVQVMVIE